MTTASIPELRKAHARTRAQLARAAVRYGKRALTGRGSGEDGPPSDQEVALLRELLAAAEAMTAAARAPGRRQLATTATALGGCRRSQPRPTVGVVVGSVPAGHGQGRWGSGGDHRGWEGIAGGGDRCLRTWTAPAAPGPARRLTMLATRLRLPPAASSQVRGGPHCGAERRRGARGSESASAVPILQPGEGNAGEPGLAHEDDGTAGA